MATAKRSLQLALKRLGGVRHLCAVPQRSLPPHSSEQKHSYHPIPAVVSQGKGAHQWDPEEINQGQGHPKNLKALVEQAQRLTLNDRAVSNYQFPTFAKRVTHMLGYEMMLPMNTRVESVETTLKLAQKWGYEKKMIPKDEAIIVSCCGCFHCRTSGVISMSCDNDATCGFGPLVSEHLKVGFGDYDALDEIFKERGCRVCAFLFEPIHGEAGAKFPPDGYLKTVRNLCSRHKVLMIADEIQTGIARSGKMLPCDWEDVRPDIMILGNALGAGVLPVSAVLADEDVMLCIKPGEHERFGGNPLASAVLDVFKDEGLADRAAKLGKDIRDDLKYVQQQFPYTIEEMRGRGLLNAVELNSKTLSPVSAYDICTRLKGRGILAKPTHDSVIRSAPPLSKSFHSTNFVQNILDEDELGSRKRGRDFVHVLMIKNKTFVTVTDNKGNKKTGASAGCLEERKGRSRLSRYAAEATAEHVGRSARKMGIKSVVMKVKGFNYFRKKSKVILSWREGFRGEGVGEQSPIMYIHDVSQLPHNGCRLPKRRRT